MYVNTESRATDNRSNFSSKRGSAVKRTLAALTLAIGLLFAGAQATPTTTKASAPCDMTCTEVTDPNTGQCSIQCCPTNPECKQPCELKPCATPTTSEKK